MKVRTAIVLCVVAGCAIALLWVWKQREEAKRASAYSTVVSLQDELTRGSVVVDIAVNPEWQVISSNTYGAVVASLKKHHLLEIGMGELKDNHVLVDPWGKAYEIAVRMGTSNQVQFVVWSKGQDGALGTADDICRPSDMIKLIYPEGVPPE